MSAAANDPNPGHTKVVHIFDQAISAAKILKLPSEILACCEMATRMDKEISQDFTLRLTSVELVMVKVLKSAKISPDASSPANPYGRVVQGLNVMKALRQAIADNFSREEALERSGIYQPAEDKLERYIREHDFVRQSHKQETGSSLIKALVAKPASSAGTPEPFRT